MAAKPGKQMIIRIITVMVVVIVALSGVSGYRLVNIMIINGEKYQSEASEQQLYDSLKVESVRQGPVRLQEDHSHSSF